MNDLNEIKKLVSEDKLDDAVLLIDGISVDYYRVQAIKLVAITYADKGEFDLSIKYADELSDEYNDKSDTLKEIALRMARQGRIDDALELSDELQYDFQRLAILNYVKKGLSNKESSGKLKEIDEIIHSMDEEEGSSNYKYNYDDDEPDDFDDGDELDDFDDDDELDDAYFEADADNELDGNSFYYNGNIKI